MQLEDYDARDGRKVWLGRDEVQRLLDVYRGEDVRRYIALALAARCGLRRQEVVDVRRRDLVETDGGLRVRVQDGKGSKYRETPIPTALFDTATTFAQTLGLDENDSLIDRHDRSVKRWVVDAGEFLQEETGDDGWEFLRPHDLRRSWGTLLLEDDVSPWIVMQWGGWDDWRTFRENYVGAPTASKQREEQGKVAWL